MSNTVPVAIEAKETFREVVRHHVDSLDWEPDYPEAQTIGHLVMEYCEKHSDEFSKKEPADAGQLPHFVYLDGGYSEPPLDDMEKDPTRGQNRDTEDEATDDDAADKMTFSLTNGPQGDEGGEQSNE